MYETPTVVHDYSVNLSGACPAPSRAQVVKLQEYMSGLPQVEMTPQHYFAEGMYVRNLPIPANTVVVGKIHRHQHMVALIKGSARINTDKGMETISAPHIWRSEPGAKRALVTLTDCEFMTMHLNPTNTHDLDVIEADVIEPEDIQLTYDTKRISS